MRSRIAPALALLFICHINHISSKDICEAEKHSPGALRVSVFSGRNQTGQWETTFYALKDDSEVKEVSDIALDISQDVAECEGKRILIVRGHIVEKDLFPDFIPPDKRIEEDSGEDGKALRFHPRCGNNVVVVNKGRTLKKLDLKLHTFGVAITNRPLKDNELFEVTLDNKTKIFHHSLAIGVTPYPPTELFITKFISELKPPSWSMYYSHLYHNTGVAKPNYGKNLDLVEVGERVGIMRRDTGTLHVFINGYDQGIAATNVPNPVYGVLELYADASMATIVDGS